MKAFSSSIRVCLIFLTRLKSLQKYSVNHCITQLLRAPCCSVAQLCPTLCDPLDFSASGFPVLHYLFSSSLLSAIGMFIQIYLKIFTYL